MVLCLTGVGIAQALFLMWLVIEDHDNLFVMAEVVHFLGIGLLAYKLTKKKNAGGAPQRTHVPARRSMEGHSHGKRSAQLEPKRDH